jgi:hypothetical protein
VSDERPGDELARRIAEDGDGSVRAILLYGSQLLNARPDRHSAYDMVVIVDDYRAFHQALDRAGELHRPVRLMTWLAGVLPPNNIAFAPDDGREGIAKCQVVSVRHFERALGPNPPDHFLLGRLVQHVETLWAATPEDEAWVAEQLADARGRVLEWMAPYLDEPVDAAGLGRRLLEVCYQGEFRPEARDRAHRIFEAQVDHFRSAFTPVLEEGVRTGLLRREGDRFALARPVSASERRRRRRYFARSKARATTRWLKHTMTFANWLPYIVRKVERHTGRTIHLTPLERKLPLIFLWPRAIHVLLSRPHREIES